jgi:hypothetical protein
VTLHFAGAAVDVAVSDLVRAEAFYSIVLGRPPDLRPRPTQCEWRLWAEPEIVLRLTTQPAHAGHSTAALGVHDLAGERARLLASWPQLPEISGKPGVIALLPLADPDGNAVTLWQDLLGTRP